jgi:WD40 repeat protein
VSFAPDKHTVASGSYDGSVWLWDVNSKIPGVRLLGHTDAVQAVIFSLVGERLASGAWDGSTRVWDVDKRTSIARLLSNGIGIEGIALSPDTRWLVTTETTGFVNSA